LGRWAGPGRRGYPAEFGRRALDLLAAGKKVGDLARALEVSEQAIYGWRRQERIDRGVEAGLSTLDRAGLAAAERRIRELEAELAVHRRASELREERTDPKGGSPPSRRWRRKACPSGWPTGSSASPNRVTTPSGLGLRRPARCAMRG